MNPIEKDFSPGDMVASPFVCSNDNFAAAFSLGDMAASAASQIIKHDFDAKPLHVLNKY